MSFPLPDIDLSNMGEREIEALGSIMDEVGAPLYMVTIGTRGATARPTPFLGSIMGQVESDDARAAIQDHVTAALVQVLDSLVNPPGEGECDCERHRAEREAEGGGDDADRA